MKTFNSKKQNFNSKFVYRLLNIITVFFAILCLLSIVINREFTNLSKIFLVIMIICELPLVIRYFLYKKDR